MRGCRQHEPWVSFSVRAGITEQVGTRTRLVSAPWSPQMLWFALGAELLRGLASHLFVPFLGSCLLGQKPGEAVLAKRGDHG